jgi:hypothetical protein
VPVLKDPQLSIREYTAYKMAFTGVIVAGWIAILLHNLK